LAKIDQKAVCSYQELMKYYRVISLTADDLDLIKGGPDERRSLLDQMIIMQNHEFYGMVQHFFKVLENRNALFHQDKASNNKETADLWTYQLWQATNQIQELRVEMLKYIEGEINKFLLEYFFNVFNVSLSYVPKYKSLQGSFEDFLRGYARYFSQEQDYRRSLFGAHLDDFAITLAQRKSRSYASRGQQKLIVLLFKIAHLKKLLIENNEAIVVLDDFMADFDQEFAVRIISFLQEMKVQLIFTSPLQESFLGTHLKGQGAQACGL
jgi:DNA replication and repair protein RecF